MFSKLVVKTKTFLFKDTFWYLMVSIHLRLNKELFSQLGFLQNEFGFNSLQEFIREAIRSAVENYEKKTLIRRLSLLKGSAKQKQAMPQKQVFEKYLKKNPSEIFRKFDL